MFRLPLLSIALMLFAFPQPAAAGDPDPVRIFEITGSGKVQHQHVATTFGAKSFVTKVNKASINECINELFVPDCADLQDNDDGKVFLYIYDSGMWGVATDPDPATAEVTLLMGVIDGKGKFMFVGTDADTEVQFLVEGKAKLDKTLGDALIPLKLKGKLRALDIDAGHTGVVNIKTVGKPLVVEV